MGAIRLSAAFFGFMTTGLVGNSTSLSQLRTDLALSPKQQGYTSLGRISLLLLCVTSFFVFPTLTYRQTPNIYVLRTYIFGVCIEQRATF